MGPFSLKIQTYHVHILRNISVCSLLDNVLFKISYSGRKVLISLYQKVRGQQNHDVQRVRDACQSKGCSSFEIGLM